MCRAARYFDGTENILLAEAHESGHLAARLGVFQGAMELHLGRGKDRRARAALADDHGKPAGADHRGDVEPFLKPADVAELDLQKIRRASFKHRQRVFRRAHALLGGDRDADGAAQLGEALQIAARQGLFGVSDMKLAEIAQDISRIDKGIGSITVDANLRVIADGAAHCAHSLDIFPIVSLADFYFEDLESLLLELTGALADCFRSEIHAQAAH